MNLRAAGSRTAEVMGKPGAFQQAHQQRKHRKKYYARQRQQNIPSSGRARHFSLYWRCAFHSKIGKVRVRARAEVHQCAVRGVMLPDE